MRRVIKRTIKTVVTETWIITWEDVPPATDDDPGNQSITADDCVDQSLAQPDAQDDSDT